METAEVVKTIYDDSPPEVQALVDALFRMAGAEEHAQVLLKKAKRILPKEQTRKSDLGSELNEIWKNCRVDGIAPDVEKVQGLWKESEELGKRIKDAQKAKGCSAKDRRVYNKAAALYKGDAVAMAEGIKGEQAKPTSMLDPKILSRIVEADKEARARSKPQ